MNDFSFILIILALFSCKAESLESELPLGCAEEFTSSTLDYSEKYVAIPDPSFEFSLVDQKLDSDGEVNGKILMADVLKVKELGVNSVSASKEYIIRDLTGLEYFKNVENLTILNCLEDSLDLTHNQKLVDLTFFAFWGGGGSFDREKALKHIKINPSTTLKKLELVMVWMNEIDISSFPNLEEILIGSEPLTTVYVRSKEQKERLVDSKTVMLRNNQEVLYKVCRK
ncbi:hypothetical protein LAG90_13210 [Marinilongibacter aquaticus]|uniref:hypothetical protein n=1 Tax=Marinilongibacter aquaticus TaxID=2975157 RepID=UPI0021BDCA57|nr:hypothetical protein [Marinilongibacter aquaticus]UBM57771.1 hypothetical protein LAG90_13210 [Marinilongibacter aquaticus]